MLLPEATSQVAAAKFSTGTGPVSLIPSDLHALHWSFLLRCPNSTFYEFIMNRTEKTFTGVVLAADRGPDDPVARTAGAPCKSFVPLGGRPMVLRVLDTLAEAREVDSLVVCGPSEALTCPGA